MKTNPKAKPISPSTKPKPAKKGGKTLAKTRPLSVRQERFAELVAAGRSGTDAWLEAGHNCTRDTARSCAAESIAKPSIAARIAQLRAPQTKKMLMSKDRKREIAMEIASNPSKSDMARIRAMELDAKLAGHFEPEQHVIESGPKTLDAVRERMRMIVSPMVRLEPRA